MNPFQKDLILNVFSSDFYDNEGYYTFNQNIILSDESKKLLMLKHTENKSDKIPEIWSLVALYISFEYGDFSIEYYDGDDYVRLYY